MKSLRAMAALAASLTLCGAAASPQGIDPPPGWYPPAGSCVGENGWKYIWNLGAPGQYVFKMDSCRVNILISQKNLAGNYSMYIALLNGKIPQVWPVSVTLMAWQTSDVTLAYCAARGRGVEFLQNAAGQVALCRAQ